MFADRLSPLDRIVLAALDEWSTLLALRAHAAVAAAFTIGPRLAARLDDLRQRGLVELHETAIGTMYRRRSRKPVAIRSETRRAVAMRKLREERRAEGKCWECPQLAVPGLGRCQFHIEKKRIGRKVDAPEAARVAA